MNGFWLKKERIAKCKIYTKLRLIHCESSQDSVKREIIWKCIFQDLHSNYTMYTLLNPIFGFQFTISLIYLYYFHYTFWLPYFHFIFSIFLTLFLCILVVVLQTSSFNNILSEWNRNNKELLTLIQLVNTLASTARQSIFFWLFSVAEWTGWRTSREGLWKAEWMNKWEGIEKEP